MKCIDNPRKLHVLYVSDGGARVQALTEVLRNRGHEVNCVQSLREILLASESHVLVLDVAQRDEEHALMLLEEIQHAGCEIPIVMISAQRNYELCRSAAEYGVPALIQDAFDPGALTNAVEHCADDTSPDAPARIGHSARYDSSSDGADQALEGLRGYLEEASINPVHITRILVASAELIDNVERHAYRDGGDFQLQAQVQGSRLWLSISDQGCGLEQNNAQLEATAPALPKPKSIKAISRGASVVFGGHSRAARLAESFEAKSDQNGSVIELEFELSPMACVGASLPALSNLQPAAMRTLVRSIEWNKGRMPELSPVLELTVQRLVGPESSHRRSLKRV